MKIRTKILLGFSILALMLAAGGAVFVYELMTMGASVQARLDDNYRSIQAAKRMTQALDRQADGILMLLSGQWKQGREAIRNADGKFRQALETAASHTTIAGEEACMEKIRDAYRQYSRLWDQPIAGTPREGNIGWYAEDARKSLQTVKTAVQNLISLNVQAMYNTASDLKNRAHRAVMPGAVTILSALMLTLLFYFFVNIYIVNPILTIRNAINKFLSNNEPISLKVDANDELAELADSVTNLAARAKMSDRGRDSDFMDNI